MCLKSLFLTGFLESCGEFYRIQGTALFLYANPIVRTGCGITVLDAPRLANTPASRSRQASQATPKGLRSLPRAVCLGMLFATHDVSLLTPFPQNASVAMQ